MPTPAHFPNNEMTQMMEQLAVRNRAGIREAPVTGGASPTVRSNSLGTFTPIAAPLTDEEKAEADAKAIELGIMDAPASEGGAYASMDDAIAAGAPVPAQYSQQAVMRTPLAPSMAGQVVRLPDFSRIQGFNFILGVVHIDGMDFEIPEADILEFKKYAVDLVRTTIMEQLDALRKSYEVLFTEEGGASETEVSEVRTDGSTDVQPGGTQEGTN